MCHWATCGLGPHFFIYFHLEVQTHWRMSKIDFRQVIVTGATDEERRDSSFPAFSSCGSENIRTGSVQAPQLIMGK